MPGTSCCSAGFCTKQEREGDLGLDAADLRAYKQVRLRTPGEAQVSVATWRRSMAALDKWAAWAIAENLLAEEPFRYLDKTVGLLWTRATRINAESEPDPGPAPVRFVPFADYLAWRDVGLRGRLPDGRGPGLAGPARRAQRGVRRPAGPHRHAAGRGGLAPGA